MYSDWIKINKNFQTSINLELDLNNERKIEEYIPTSDICDVLKKYIRTCLNQSPDKATTLVGPYGKGKSFLLLVLSYIISKKEKTETYKQLLKKIKAVDKGLYQLIKEYDKKGSRLLPVIVNHSYDNLTQSFQLALNDALHRYQIEVVPETVYSLCLQMIDKWQKDDEIKSRAVAKCSELHNITLENLIQGLKEYSPGAYRKFEDVYNCITGGLPFNPLVNPDVVHVYSTVNHELCQNGWEGMFIIFDEFSKFLDSADETLPRNLKIIQDFAEYASRSGVGEQMHLCCVTHKSLELYSTGSRADLFRTVEGRFKEIRFNRSLSENYQIISAAIQKEDHEQVIEKYIDENEEFYREAELFSAFRADADLNTLFRGCFPLNPFTVYSLIQLSEIIAQNERTLFTFISDNDDNSFNSFINNNETGLFNVDKVYDYFSVLMRREENNDIRNIWYRSEGTLARIDEPDMKRIIKALAVILMLKSPEQFAPDAMSLHLATMIPLAQVESIIKQLSDLHYLRKNVINNQISFASTNSREIEERINVIAQTKAKNISYTSSLEEIDDIKYLLPRRYNAQRKITRFYRVVYMTEEQLASLNNLNVIKATAEADGLVISVLRKNLSEETIQREARRLCPEKDSVIFRYPDTRIEDYFDELVVRYASLKDILNKGGNDEVVTTEIELLSQEVREDIQSLIAEYFGDTAKYYNPGELVQGVSPSELLSRNMFDIFSKDIVFNNELINKNSVTTQYQKPINNVIDKLLKNNEDAFWTETSPERTVEISVVEEIDKQKEVRKVVDEIKKAISDADGRKRSVTELVKQYNQPPFGIRKGILPILFAQAISELSDNVLLYLKEKEIDLTAVNLVKSINAEDGYYIGFAKGSTAQSDYLNNMLQVLGKKPTNNFRTDTKMLSNELRRFFVGLPLIIRSATKNNVLGIDARIIEYKGVFMSFNLNPYETVYVKPMKVFRTEEYKDIQEILDGFIRNWNNYLNLYKATIADKIKDELIIDKNTSLRMGMSVLMKGIVGNTIPVLSDADNTVFKLIPNMSFSDLEAVNELAKALLGTYIEDWANGRDEELIRHLTEFIDALKQAEEGISVADYKEMTEIPEDYKESAMGILFKNSLESVFDEFGESVTNEEKIMILRQMIKDMM